MHTTSNSHLRAQQHSAVHRVTHEYDAHAPQVTWLVVRAVVGDRPFEHLGGGVVQGEAGRQQAIALWLQLSEAKVNDLDVRVVRLVFIQKILAGRAHLFTCTQNERVNLNALTPKLFH